MSKEQRRLKLLKSYLAQPKPPTIEVGQRWIWKPGHYGRDHRPVYIQPGEVFMHQDRPLVVLEVYDRQERMGSKSHLELCVRFRKNRSIEVQCLVESPGWVFIGGPE